MTNAPLLYPAPRHIEVREPSLDLAVNGTILMPASPSPSSFRSAQRAQKALELGGGRWPIAAAAARPDQPVVQLSVDAGATGESEGYRMEVSASGVRIIGDDDAGLFYGVATLAQLLTGRSVIPYLSITDHPSIRRRGVMLDVSRDRVQTMQTLKELVDQLSGWKYNELQLYMEHAFAYAGHETVWGDASPLTAEEIAELDIYCRERFIELVPNQNTLGHLHKWLEHPAYAHLAENHPYRHVDVVDHVMHRGEPFWGEVPYSICPADPDAVSFVLGLLDELLPNFTSRRVNVGLDEPFDLAFGRSRELAPDVPPQQLYVNFVHTLHQHLTKQGYTLQMWGDFVADHPESVSDLPHDIVVVDWGYWKEYPFEERAALYAGAGIDFYFATGTNAWCSLGGRYDETVIHMRAATDAALKHGAQGILVTDWGWFQHGTYQQHVISSLGFLLGAGELWSPAQSRTADFASALSTFALDDASGVLGEALIELGTVCQGGGRAIIDNSPLYWALRDDLDWIAGSSILTEADLDEGQTTLGAVETRLKGLVARSPAAARSRDELLLTVELLRHGIGRTKLAREADPAQRDALRSELHAALPGLVGRFEQLWLDRYRPGGLTGTSHSLRRHDREYRETVPG